MNTEYEKTQQKINDIRNELAKLYAEQDAIIMTYKDMPALSGMTKEETLEQLLRANPRFNELSAQIDKLETKLGPLVEKNRQLAEEMSKVGNESKNISNQMSNMGNSAKKATKSILGLTLFKRIFNGEAKRATQTTSNFGRTLNRVSKIIVRNLIVYGLIIKGIKGFDDPANCRLIFTFYCSSIKSSYEIRTKPKKNSLHSTVVLLMASFQ
jgi:chromosome segregation ATPase